MWVDPHAHGITLMQGVPIKSACTFNAEWAQPDPQFQDQMQNEPMWDGSPALSSLTNIT